MRMLDLLALAAALAWQLKYCFACTGQLIHAVLPCCSMARFLLPARTNAVRTLTRRWG